MLLEKLMQRHAQKCANLRYRVGTIDFVSREEIELPELIVQILN
jgi:hypothetical protein